MALGLRLDAVAAHDLLERFVPGRHLGHDVDRAHEDLVEVPVLHQVDVVRQAVLEARPDLTAQLRRDVQLLAQVSQPHARQVVHLRENARQAGTIFDVTRSDVQGQHKSMKSKTEGPSDGFRYRRCLAHNTETFSLLTRTKRTTQFRRDDETTDLPEE